MQRRNVKSEGKGRAFNVKLPDDVWALLVARVTDHGTSRKHEVCEAIRQRVGLAVVSKYHPTNTKWHQALELILNGASPDTARTIRNILSVFGRDSSAETDTSSQKGSAPKVSTA